MKIRITEKGIEHLKSFGIKYWIMRRLYKDVCITQKEWNNMSNKEKNELMEELIKENEKKNEE